jgi:hypothetical protein
LAAAEAAAARDAWLLPELLELLELAGRAGWSVGLALPCDAGALRGLEVLPVAGTLRVFFVGSTFRCGAGRRSASMRRPSPLEVASARRSSSAEFGRPTGWVVPRPPCDRSSSSARSSWWVVRAARRCRSRRCATQAQRFRSSR